MKRSRWTHEIETPFRLRSTVISHGWCEVPPMEWEESTQTFYLAERIEDELYLLAILFPSASLFP